MDGREGDILDMLDIPEHVEANPDLAEYAASHRASQSERSGGEKGACLICGTSAQTRCLRCERSFCTQHLLLMVGLCGSCARPAADHEGHTRPELDVEWIE